MADPLKGLFSGISPSGVILNIHPVEDSFFTEVLKSDNPIIKIPLFPVGVHGIEITLPRKIRMEGQAHEAPFPYMGYLQDGEWVFLEFPTVDQPNPPRPFAYQCPAIRKKYKRPGYLEILYPNLDLYPYPLREEFILYGFGRLCPPPRGAGA